MPNVSSGFRLFLSALPYSWRLSSNLTRLADQSGNCPAFGLDADSRHIPKPDFRDRYNHSLWNDLCLCGDGDHPGRGDTAIAAIELPDGDDCAAAGAWGTDRIYATVKEQGG
jgi:hypothetical protein